MSTSQVLNTIQSVILALVVPGGIYYVENYTPYTKDKRYIEQRISTNEKAIEKLTIIVDRVTREKS